MRSSSAATDSYLLQLSIAASLYIQDLVGVAALFFISHASPPCFDGAHAPTTSDKTPSKAVRVAFL